MLRNPSGPRRASSDRFMYRLLIWPSFVVLFVLTILPLAFNFCLAFTDTTITTMNKAKFIGWTTSRASSRRTSTLTTPA